MLERLYATLASGPLLNCRPHSSRQRVCLCELEALKGARPSEIVQALLSPAGKVRLTAGAAKAPGAAGSDVASRDESRANPAQSKTAQSKTSQSKTALPRDPMAALWKKLRTIEADAAAYEKETGVQALYLGYPLLSLPPQEGRTGLGASGKRIVAPVTFIPVSLEVKASRTPSVTLEATGNGADLVIANQALLAFAQQVSQLPLEELFVDESGTEPFREIGEVIRVVTQLLGIATPEPLTADTTVIPFPESDNPLLDGPRIIPSAVLGLFPLSRQSLLRDLHALTEEAARGSEPPPGPIRAFLDAKLELDGSVALTATASMRESAAAAAADPKGAGIGEDRAISPVDPCQRRAVLMARTSSALVLHGPPGTGKSQTIANVIADHLANGMRVLFVCDKRTALDVVHTRLTALGLGGFCAVVHDAQRDEKELYRGLREELDALPQKAWPPEVDVELKQADLELTRLHAELDAYHRAAQVAPGPGELSFHELLGQFLGLSAQSTTRVAPVGGVTRGSFAEHERALKELLERGIAASYGNNPWVPVLDATLEQYLSRPPATWNQHLSWLLTAAQAIDQATEGTPLPLLGQFELRAQQAMLTWLREAVETVALRQGHSKLAYWASADPRLLATAHAEVMRLLPLVGAIGDPRITPQVQHLSQSAQLVSLPELQQFTSVLSEYVRQADSWHHGVFSGGSAAANDVFARFGIAPSRESAQLALAALEVMRQRRTLFDWYVRFGGPPSVLPPDTEFWAALELHRVIFEIIGQVTQSPLLAPLSGQLLAHLRDPGGIASLLPRLSATQIRSTAVAKFEEGLAAFALLSGPYRAGLRQRSYEGASVVAELASLNERAHELEDLCLIRKALRALPLPLHATVLSLLNAGVGGEVGSVVMRRAILEGQLLERVSQFPALTAMDERRLNHAAEHFESTRLLRQELGRDAIISRLSQRQRHRLVAADGGRLSPLGAELRRRFISRGENALRLRQAVAVGTAIPEGDPLFDLRPVWMVSPEVSCQVFPRLPLFDLVVFDEASQCRLEESLPVLLRGKRVLIAGDPEQLPPTRFFESTASGAAYEADAELTEQDLFEQQQSEVADLLGASLNLAIEQTYLDVHYRSKHADLIAFSNEHFYRGRLQPLPSQEPKAQAEPPIRFCPVQGTYENRTNPKEAEAVVQLVRELLAREEPPSIGIACFNLSQRDAILEALDNAAIEDEAFEKQLEAARTRESKGSFEGLFVKNLENVQGDERDHLIISTTYGPDAEGKFFRRFGPLAQAGGGKRLNVLITRAREQIHLFTSIPESVYRSVPDLGADAKPNGGWLLLKYLAFAADRAKALGLRQLPAQAASGAQVSPVVAVLREQLEASGIPTQAPYGSPGLGCDLFFSNPAEAGENLAILLDVKGYPRAPDPVEWDLFRRRILAYRGFTLKSLLLARLFRNWELEVGGLVKLLREKSTPAGVAAGAPAGVAARKEGSS